MLAPLAMLLAGAIGALPSPPEKVVFQTRSFGTVTIDHRAHLARRAHCARCHGPGPVRTIPRMEPKVAHGRCVGCHQESGRGPTGCRGCHLVTTAIASAPEAVAAAGAPTPAVDGPTVDLPAALPFPEDAAGAPAAPDPPPPERARTALELGWSVLSSSAHQQSTGPTFRVSLRSERLLLRESLEWSTGGRRSRSLGTTGFGAAFPVGERWSGLALAVAGFDAFGGPPVSFLPAIGLQLGVERSTSLAFFDGFGLSFTALTDLGRRTSSFGEQVGGVTLLFSATAAIDVRERR